jgi:hypothetical protein
MQRLDVRGAVRPLYGSLGVKGLSNEFQNLLWIRHRNQLNLKLLTLRRISEEF